jgi:hypothetical protein
MAALPGVSPGGAQQLVPAYFDNATKLLSLQTQQYVGITTFGAAAIGQGEPRTAHSFLPELDALLAEAMGKRA